MSKFKKIKYVIAIVSIILASIYLTFLIDTSTLNTNLKRAFILCYFILASCLAFFFYNKSKARKNTVIPLLCAIIVVFFGQNLLLPTKSDHTFYIQAVEVTNEKDEETGAETPEEEKEFKEAWLVDITVDGNSKQLSLLKSNANTLWSYEGYYDDYFFLPNENSASNILSFDVIGEEITVSFGANTWSGNVRIFNDYGYDEIVCLYNEDPTYDRISHTMHLSKTFSTFERILYNLGAVAVFTFVFKVLFLLIFRFIDKKRGGKLKSAK